MENAVSLSDAAELLGVHYMTAYKYVRTGRLVAHKHGGVWCVRNADIDAFRQRPASARQRSNPALIESRLLLGDDAGVHRILLEALGSGATIVEAYVDLLAPAMASVGDRWAAGELSIADEHAATTTAFRAMSRFGAALGARGRMRGTVLVASVENDLHSLPTAMLRDLLRSRRYDVVDLGANAPAESVVQMAVSVPDLLAVGLAATTPDNEKAISSSLQTFDAHLDVPVVLGGGAIRGQDHGHTLGPCSVSISARHALDLFDDIHSASLPSTPDTTG